MTIEPEPSSGRSDPRLGEIMDARRQLISLAYRLLGSLAEAEDVVQETYARWYAMSPDQQDAIVSPVAWMTTVTSRQCLNVLSSARARRETYVGEWIPEPLPEATGWIAGRTDTSTGDPADRVTLDESINMAFLVVLESMTPAERVSFILHDVFRYSFAEVADVVGRTPAACRQLAHSARGRIRSAQPLESSATEHAAIIKEFKQAWEAADIESLVALLAPDATLVSDGGGHVRTVLEPINGADQIVRFMTHLERQFRNLTITLMERTVNDRLGLIAQQDGVTVSVYAFEVVGDRIKQIWVVRNPDKLHPWMDGTQQ